MYLIDKILIIRAIENRLSTRIILCYDSFCNEAQLIDFYASILMARFISFDGFQLKIIGKEHQQI